MTLYEKLEHASSEEEDVKDIYIKALGLTKYQKNLIDIQTKEIWFEAKDGYRNTTYEMFTQLLHYVKQATTEGEYIPPFLCVIDTRKAAIMRTEDAMFLINRKDIKWGKSASDYSQEALDAVSQYLGTYFVSFNIKTHETEFIQIVKSAIKEGKLIRTQITPNNLKQVFDKWVEMIGREVLDVEEDKYDQLFYADIMSDGTRSTHENLPAELIFKGGKPAFMISGQLYELGNHEGYRNFWNIYNRPPKEEYRNYLLERRDSLIPTDERAFNGDYYTPLMVVDKAYDYLDQALGSTWQKDYLVWDMCCGVGNLETKHSNHRKLFMSTLNQVDVDVMKATKTCRVAERFQYDYLNDDIAEDGTIDFFGLQKGDSIRVVFDEQSVDEQCIGIGRIYAANFYHANKWQEAFFFNNTYFDADGKSLKKAFLKAPLNYKRISSRFTYARKHPIFKTVRPHTGVDYAAPMGTPVVSIGDGTVIEKGYKGGGGNTVKIRHNSTYTTAYLHLSKYGQGISVGSHVSQGQIIGYVGSTGNSTGPHLDFRIWKNGTPVDPLKLVSPPSEPVPSKLCPKFDSIVNVYRSKL